MTARYPPQTSSILDELIRYKDAPSQQPDHPVCTDFGPDTLAAFIRSSLESIKAEYRSRCSRYGKHRRQQSSEQSYTIDDSSKGDQNHPFPTEEDGYEDSETHAPSNGQPSTSKSQAYSSNLFTPTQHHPLCPWQKFTNGQCPSWCLIIPPYHNTQAPTMTTMKLILSSDAIRGLDTPAYFDLLRACGLEIAHGLSDNDAWTQVDAQMRVIQQRDANANDIERIRNLQEQHWSNKRKHDKIADAHLEPSDQEQITSDQDELPEFSTQTASDTQDDSCSEEDDITDTQAHTSLQRFQYERIFPSSYLQPFPQRPRFRCKSLPPMALEDEQHTEEESILTKVPEAARQYAKEPDSRNDADAPATISKHLSKRLKNVQHHLWESVLDENSRMIGMDSEQRHRYVNVQDLDHEIWQSICSHVSSQDVRRLRLVSRRCHKIITPIMLRSTVVRFGHELFGTTTSSDASTPSSSSVCSLLRDYGSSINKFGIVFEYDLNDLGDIKPKIMQSLEETWYGSYTWPLPEYPRFPQQQEMEDLLDNNRELMKDAVRHLSNAKELALSVDSGHGWLEGPDVSDMQLLERQIRGGEKVFGKAFSQEDIWHEFGRDQYFQWAQQNTLDEGLKPFSMLPRKEPPHENEWTVLEEMSVRSYDSYRCQNSQFDFDEKTHTGNQREMTVIRPEGDPAPETTRRPAMNLNSSRFHPRNGSQLTLTQMWRPRQPRTMPQTLSGLGQGRHLNNQCLSQPPGHLNHSPRAGQGYILRRTSGIPREDTNPFGSHDRTNVLKQGNPKRQIQSQWPIIFNGHNIAAQAHGRGSHVQCKIADVQKFPFYPGSLTEAQVQWLMELAWAQRAFLSSYIVAIMSNKMAVSNVHTLSITKMSSGLLDSLNLSEFWTSLPELRNVTLLVSPDWRREHVINDQSFNRNMLRSPLQAVKKFTGILSTHILRVERLYRLRIGFVGGGEHAVGIFARNQHVLPAPIVADAAAWLRVDQDVPEPNLMLRFDHVRHLTFENCWFSPYMLETFVARARDTSLHQLTLDSVSLTCQHGTGRDIPLTARGSNLACKWDKEDWLYEEVPFNACWVQVLDRITPGITMLERKLARGMVKFEVEDVPSREFRGNVEKIILKSCGYVQIGGVGADRFNQNSLVVHERDAAMDCGVRLRREKLEVNLPLQQAESHGEHTRPILQRVTRSVFGRNNGDREAVTTPAPRKLMMSTIDENTGKHFFGLGKLTQCIHPIEKRILEGAWKISFGWGDDMRRWGPVDDGFFEGGTGRFSGVISKDDRDECLCPELSEVSPAED